MEGSDWKGGRGRGCSMYLCAQELGRAGAAAGESPEVAHVLPSQLPIQCQEEQMC